MRINQMHPSRARLRTGPGRGLRGLGDASSIVASLDNATGALGDASDIASSLGVDPSITSAIDSIGSAASDLSDTVYQATGQDASLPAVNVSATPLPNWLVIGGVVVGGLILVKLAKKR